MGVVQRWRCIEQKSKMERDAVFLVLKIASNVSQIIERAQSKVRGGRGRSIFFFPPSPWLFLCGVGLGEKECVRGRRCGVSCSEQTSSLAQDLAELQQSIYVTRSTISPFVSKRCPDPSFDICLQSLRSSLEKVEGLLPQFVQCGVNMIERKNELLLEIGKIDFLIKQKGIGFFFCCCALIFLRAADQFHFLFGPPDVLTASKMTDAKGKVTAKLRKGFFLLRIFQLMWVTAFGADVRIVPFREFFPVFMSASGEQQQLSEAEMQTLNQYIDFTLDGWVSVYEFEVFLLSFGPLPGCATRMLTPCVVSLLELFVPHFFFPHQVQEWHAGRLCSGLRMQRFAQGRRPGIISHSIFQEQSRSICSDVCGFQSHGLS